MGNCPLRDDVPVIPGGKNKKFDRQADLKAKVGTAERVEAGEAQESYVN